MPSTTQAHYLSIKDYLLGEHDGDYKHEYVDGMAYAMAGASVNHNQISANVMMNLMLPLKGKPCRPFSSDLMLKTSDTSYRYPDVMVVCDDQFIDDYSTDSPTLLVEVLSSGTRKVDKRDKLEEYLRLPSLMEYVLIEQDIVEVEVFRRSAGWRPVYYYVGDVILFESIGVELGVDEIYERVVFS